MATSDVRCGGVRERAGSRTGLTDFSQTSWLANQTSLKKAAELRALTNGFPSLRNVIEHSSWFCSEIPSLRVF